MGESLYVKRIITKTFITSIHFKIHLNKVGHSLLKKMIDLRITFLTHTFSQKNAIMDNAVPIPRNMNAGNENVKNYSPYSNYLPI